MAPELIYKLIIYRTDGNDIEILETDKFEEAKKLYKALDVEWVASTAEKRPFRHPKELHSFHPSLILEIKVETMSKEEYQRSMNPYHQQMHREGFNGAMNQNFNTNGGY